jgi:hypothetical protein
MIQQIRQIQRVKEGAKGIDQDVKLGIYHPLPDPLGKARTQAEDFALMRNGKRRSRNGKIDGPTHGVKLKHMTICSF